MLIMYHQVLNERKKTFQTYVALSMRNATRFASVVRVHALFSLATQSQAVT